MNAGLITTKAVALAAAGAVSTVGFSLAANAAAPTPAITPTVVSYAPVDMGTLASHPLTSIYLNAPTGSSTLSGVPFNLANFAFITSGNKLALASTVHKPLSVSVLMNSAYGYNYYKGQVVGRVHLSFSDGTAQDTDIVAGGQVREWWLNSGYLIDTLTSTSAKNVWQGQAATATGLGTTPVVIDMVTVPVAATSADLTGVSVSDSASSPFDLLVSGVTVGYVNPTIKGGGDDNNNDSKGDNNNNDRKDVEKVNKPTPKKPAVRPEKKVADRDQHSEGGPERD